MDSLTDIDVEETRPINHTMVGYCLRKFLLRSGLRERTHATDDTGDKTTPSMKFLRLPHVGTGSPAESVVQYVTYCSNKQFYVCGGVPSRSRSCIKSVSVGDDLLFRH